MKGYLALLLAIALLLLLLPLPALSSSSSADTTPEASAPDNAEIEKTEESTPPTSTETPTEAAVFRLLCGEEVVVMEQRDFLICTLAMEMNATYHSEALKAQTVAAYTYYARRRQQQRENADEALRGADFITPHADFPTAYTEEELRRRWGAYYEMYHAKISAAVDEVMGQTITYEGALIDACYHAMSAGCTASAQQVWGADVPYLQATASPGDRLAPNFEVTTAFSAEDVRAALAPTVNLEENPAEWFGTPTLSSSGYVESIPVGDSVQTGVQVRQWLGLRSAAFSIRYEDGGFSVTTYGYGHGVGMSQYGADYLARQGYSYKEILEYYYTRVSVG